MASLLQRGNKYCVVYFYVDLSGARKQKWETYDSYEDALKRKAEVESYRDLRKASVSKCKTIDELMKEYISLYGKAKWSLSIYDSNTRLIDRYIRPLLGNMPIQKVNTHVLERFYINLMSMQAPSPGRRTQGKTDEQKELRFVTVPTIKRIHGILRSAFNQAVKWELLDKNPANNATLPEVDEKRRDIWDAETFFRAIAACEDERLRLCMNLAFACSLRVGEILALTWDCVDISEKSIAEEKASIYINKTLQRVTKQALADLNNKDVLYRFPDVGGRTVNVLKKPKTFSSIRRVYLPTTVARQLVAWKKNQEYTITALGQEYQDYNLVVPTPWGTPGDITTIDQGLKELIQKHQLPEVVFHSLRHTSITYKLKLNGGDIKSVQGDSGHAQAQMITERYSHILDESRVTNAQLLERAFYSKSAIDPNLEQSTYNDTYSASGSSSDPNRELVEAVIQNPDALRILRSLLDSLDSKK